MAVRGRRVVVVQEVLTRYRVPLYERLRPLLAEVGIALDLVHGAPTDSFASRGLAAHLPWATEVTNRHLRMLPGRAAAVWQPALRLTRGADLVVVEQANRQLLNYPLLLGQALRAGPPVAFWGHGANLQARDPHAWDERVRRRVARLPHWWFAYTEGSAARIRSTGYPGDRITVLNNSVETGELQREVPRAPHRAVHLGSLYAERRIDFLIRAADRLAERIPDFELLVIGAGELAGEVRDAARSRPWLRAVGPRQGRERDALLAGASVALMPGPVGLGVLDVFAAGLPLVTCEQPGHGPEFEYLVAGTSGLVTAADATPDEYAATVADLLADRPRLAAMRDAALRTVSTYSIDAMAEHFAEGVVAALAAPRGGR